MGLFSKSKNSSPLPVITVNLNSPQDHVFKPNDIIAGHITLSTSVPLNPTAIEASLWGESSVWVRHSSRKSDSNTTDYMHFRDIVSLFNITFNVLTEKHLQPGPVYTFPFQFIMPGRTEISRAGGYKDDNNTLFTVYPHTLPPTFMWGSQPDYPDHALIRYGVTARLVCPGISVSQRGASPLESTLPIIFAPHNPHIHQPFSVVPHTKPFTLASSTLAGTDPSTLGFRKKLSDRFSASTPKLDFQLGIQAPDFLTSGTEFRFAASFAVLHASHNVVTVPPLTFRVLKLELRETTHMRAPRDHMASNTMMGAHVGIGMSKGPTPLRGHEELLHRETKTALNALPESQGAEVVLQGGEKGVGGQAGSCECWFAARVPGFVPPNFRSFAITRSYLLKVKMGVEVGGMKFEYEVESVVNGVGSA